MLAPMAHAQVLHFWSGALTAHSIRVQAMVDSTCHNVRLVVDDDPYWGSPAYSSFGNVQDSSGRTVYLRRSGLQPGTAYNYRFEVNGTVDTSFLHTGRFRTPDEGPSSFSFVVGSCASGGSYPVWQSMSAVQPLFFLSSGDLHYADPNSNDVLPHRNAYITEVHQQPAVSAFLHNTPIAYVWDDHDFSGNSSHAGSIGKASAARAYREQVPHYELPSDTAIYQSFTIGRVRFILSDMRSQKGPFAMMGNDQYAWLKHELHTARDSGQVACWVTSLPWNSIGFPENWGSQPDERAWLSDWMRTNAIKDLFIISGDAHMLAIDDGANADFSTGQDSPYRYPIFQAAAIARYGSYKGGTFNQGGYHPNPGIEHGQFGEVLVDDDGEYVCITFNGWRTDSMSTDVSLVNTYSFCRQPQQEDVVPEVTLSDELGAWYDSVGSLVLTGPTGSAFAELLLVDATGRVLVERAVAISDTRTLLPLGRTAPGVYTARISIPGRTRIVRFAITQ